MKPYSYIKQNNIYHLLSDRPHLEPVFKDTHAIAERVHEYDNTLFLVYDHQSGRFQIHSTDTDLSYNATLPYKNLDARTMRYIRKNDATLHREEIRKRLEESDRKREEANRKKEKDFIEDFATEFQSEFAKDAWL